VLNQVALAGASIIGIVNQAADCIELVITWENQLFLAPFLVLNLLLDDVNEVLDQIEYATRSPDFFPQVGGRIVSR
jgi:hypothetical protein